MQSFIYNHFTQNHIKYETEHGKRTEEDVFQSNTPWQLRHSTTWSFLNLNQSMTRYPIWHQPIAPLRPWMEKDRGLSQGVCMEWVRYAAKQSLLHFNPLLSGHNHRDSSSTLCQIEREREIDREKEREGEREREREEERERLKDWR